MQSPTTTQGTKQNYFEDPSVISWGRAAPRAYYIPYASVEAALARGESPRVQSLNGGWQFHYSETVAEAPSGFEQPTFDTGAWDLITVPGMWQLQGYGRPHYTNRVFP